MTLRTNLLVGSLLVLLSSACASGGLYLFDPPLKSGRRSPDGKQQGPWTYWYDTGREHPKAQGAYVDDRQTGTWTYTYENGHKEWEGVLQDERMQGLHTFWYESGQMRAQGQFDQGLETGRWTYWTPQGTKYREGDYAQGRPAGEWTYYYPGGEKLAEGAHEHGAKTGLWRFWNEQGEERERAYSGGAPVDAGSSAAGGDPEEPEAWILAEVDKPIKIPFRAQPWTENEDKHTALIVARYRDGGKSVKTPATGQYSRRATANKPKRDKRRSEALLGKGLAEFGFTTGEGEDLDLERYRGKHVVLVVLRGMGGEVCVYCVGQTIALAEEQDEFTSRGAEIVVVYPGGTDRLDAFFEGYKLLQKKEGEPPFPVVCDAETALVKTLDIQANLALPTTLILDGAGIVRYAYVGLDKEDRPSAADLLRALEDLPRS